MSLGLPSENLQSSQDAITQFVKAVKREDGSWDHSGKNRLVLVKKGNDLAIEFREKTDLNRWGKRGVATADLERVISFCKDKGIKNDDLSRFLQGSAKAQAVFKNALPEITTALTVTKEQKIAALQSTLESAVKEKNYDKAIQCFKDIQVLDSNKEFWQEARQVFSKALQTERLSLTQIEDILKIYSYYEIKPSTTSLTGLLSKYLSSPGEWQRYDVLNKLFSLIPEAIRTEPAYTKTVTDVMKQALEKKDIATVAFLYAKLSLVERASIQIDSPTKQIGEFIVALEAGSIQEAARLLNTLDFFNKDGTITDIGKKILDQPGKELLMKTNKEGATLLHQVCREGPAHIAFGLCTISPRQVIQQKDSSGKTPFTCACEAFTILGQGEKEVIQLLVKNRFFQPTEQHYQDAVRTGLADVAMTILEKLPVKERGELEKRYTHALAAGQIDLAMTILGRLPHKQYSQILLQLQNNKEVPVDKIPITETYMTERLAAVKSFDEAVQCVRSFPFMHKQYDEEKVHPRATDLLQKLVKQYPELVDRLITESKSSRQLVLELLSISLPEKTTKEQFWFAWNGQETKVAMQILEKLPVQDYTEIMDHLKEDKNVSSLAMLPVERLISARLFNIDLKLKEKNINEAFELMKQYPFSNEKEVHPKAADFLQGRLVMMTRYKDSEGNTLLDLLAKDKKYATLVVQIMTNKNAMDDEDYSTVLKYLNSNDGKLKNKELAVQCERGK